MSSFTLISAFSLIGRAGTKFVEAMVPEVLMLDGQSDVGSQLTGGFKLKGAGYIGFDCVSIVSKKGLIGFGFITGNECIDDSAFFSTVSGGGEIERCDGEMDFGDKLGELAL